MNYAPRISFPYSDISNVIYEWSKTCDSIIAYEHEADEEVKTTHCHILIMGSKYKKQDQLVKQFHKLVNTNRNGNDLWSWKHKKYPNVDINFIRYMSKGVLAPKFVKNISEHLVEELRQKWVVESPITSAASNSKSSTKDDLYCIIEEIKEELSKIEKPIQVTPWLTQGEVEFDQIVQMSIKVLQKHRKRWNSYDLERYIMPIAMDYPRLQTKFIEKIRSKFFSS